MTRTTVTDRPSQLARQHVELLARFLTRRVGEWHRIRAIRVEMQRDMMTVLNIRYISNAANVLRQVFGWDIQSGYHGLRLVELARPVVWPDDIDAQVDLALGVTPEKRRIAAELEQASVEHEGKSYIRASVAAKIMGITPGVQTNWITRSKINPKRWRVERSSKAPRGLVTAWPLDQAIDCAMTYEAMSVLAWSDADIDYLVEHTGDRSIENIAQDLRRSVAAIRDKLGDLGLTQRNAQGLMTTGEVGKLCGVSREAVQTWCFHREAPLTFKRTHCQQKVKLISTDALRQFFKSHPRIIEAKSKTVQRRVERYLMTAYKRRREVMA